MALNVLLTSPSLLFALLSFFLSLSSNSSCSPTLCSTLFNTVHKLHGHILPKKSLQKQEMPFAFKALCLLLQELSNKDLFNQRTRRNNCYRCLRQLFIWVCCTTRTHGLLHFRSEPTKRHLGDVLPFTNALILQY